MTVVALGAEECYPDDSRQARLASPSAASASALVRASAEDAAGDAKARVGVVMYCWHCEADRDAHAVRYYGTATEYQCRTCGHRWTLKEECPGEEQFIFFFPAIHLFLSLLRQGVAAMRKIHRVLSERMGVKRTWLLVALVLLGLVVSAGGGTIWLAHRHQMHLHQAELRQRELHRRAEVEACAACLPEGMTLAEKFADSPEPIPGRGGHRRVSTVREKLLQFGAHCEDGVVYDRQGRKVFFYRMQEVDSPPLPEQWRQVMKKEKEELLELEAQGVVVRMYRTEIPY
jgi:hypothetical protein